MFKELLKDFSFHRLRGELEAFVKNSAICIIPVKLLFFPFLFLRHLFLLKRHRVEFDHLEVVLTAKCTLNCRKCANLMQYYKEPPSFPAEEILQDVKDLLSLLDHVNEFGIIGGEPFLHNAVADVAELLCSSKKIKNVIIVTNGTVIPKENVLARLKNCSRLEVQISNYNHIAQARTNEVYRALQKAGVNVRIITYAWREYHFSPPKGKSIPELEKTFRKCLKCNELFDGAIHFCPTSSNGMKCGFIPHNEKEYCSIRLDGTKKQFRERKQALHHFLRATKYISACDQCENAPDNDVIPVAEQLSGNVFLTPDGREQKRRNS